MNIGVNSKSIVALMLILSIQSAKCDDAVFLPINKPAPFTGYLITPDKANSIRNDSIDLSTQVHVNSNLTQENALLNQRLTNSQQQGDYLSKQLVSERDSSFLSKAAFFVFGAAVTGLISYGIYKSK
jgi:hypothetical protein